MRVVFLNPGGSALGGAERSLALLVDGLAARGADVTVVLLHAGSAEAMFIEAQAHVVVLEGPSGLSRHGGLARSAGGVLRAAPAVVRASREVGLLIRSLQPDVVHSNGFRSHVLSAVMPIQHAPLVWSVRDIAPHVSQRVLLAQASRRAAAVVANSHVVATQVRFATARVRVVANPIATPRAIERTVARRSLQLPSERPVVAVIGHLHASKGQRVVVESLARISAEARPILAIAGAPLYGSESEVFVHELAARVRELELDEDVVFLGGVDDIDLVYRAADAIVVPSIHPEGFGRVVVEAQAAGVPVVATTAGNLAELVRDEVNGLAVAAEDPVAMAHAVERVLRDQSLRSQLIAGGRVAAERYAPENHVAAMLDVYDEVRR